jgi:uncharacterized protein YndB with AHSA1/START domain
VLNSRVATIKLSKDFDLPAEQLFDALADQGGMGRWMGVRISVPVRGAEGLVGTVRRIHLGLVSFDEEITHAERPHSLRYRVIRGVPLLRHHRGELVIAPLSATQSRLTWTVELSLAVPLLASLSLQSLAATLRRALGRLQTQLN